MSAHNSACIGGIAQKIDSLVARTSGMVLSCKACGSPLGNSISTTPNPTIKSPNLKSGDMVPIPWRVALALQADGWILRSDIPFVKRSPMPESVKNRPAKALEYVFMLVKKPGYYFDMDAVRKGRNFWQADLWFDSVDKPHGLTGVGDELVGLDVTSQGYAAAHFATFPLALVEPLIKAATSEYGCCAGCGAPWRRVLETEKLTRERPNDYVKYATDRGIKSGLNKDRRDGGRSNVGGVNSCANTVAGVRNKTVGWESTCRCEADTVPCTVLDPFIGSGSSCCVALALGRRSLGDRPERDLPAGECRSPYRGASNQVRDARADTACGQAVYQGQEKS